MLVRLAGDTDLARQLAALFVGECPRMLTAIEDGIRSGSADDLRRAAHAFKGSVLNFVEDGPAALAYTLETMGRENSLEGAGPAFARLRQEVAALVEHLKAFEAGGGGSAG
jgi:HPt (histidine-containing phosphotransfer) domain-containing protein